MCARHLQIVTADVNAHAHQHRTITSCKPHYVMPSAEQEAAAGAAERAT